MFVAFSDRYFFVRERRVSPDAIGFVPFRDINLLYSSGPVSLKATELIASGETRRKPVHTGTSLKGTHNAWASGNAPFVAAL